MSAGFLRARRLWLGAAAAAGLGAGLAWQWRRQDLASSDAPGEPLPADFWAQRFETLDPAAPLQLSTLQGRPLLVNFWATWCPPCVKEMPDLEQFHRQQGPDGWRVLGLAIDGPTPVRQFLTKTPVSFPIGLAGFGGTELAATLGNAAGGLPFSVLIDRAGRIRQRKMGATHLQELKDWASAFQ